MGTDCNGYIRIRGGCISSSIFPVVLCRTALRVESQRVRHALRPSGGSRGPNWPDPRDPKEKSLRMWTFVQSLLETPLPQVLSRRPHPHPRRPHSFPELSSESGSAQAKQWLLSADSEILWSGTQLVTHPVVDPAVRKGSSQNTCPCLCLIRHLKRTVKKAARSKQENCCSN